MGRCEHVVVKRGRKPIYEYIVACTAKGCVQEAKIHTTLKTKLTFDRLLPEDQAEIRKALAKIGWYPNFHCNRHRR